MGRERQDALYGLSNENHSSLSPGHQTPGSIVSLFQVSAQSAGRGLTQPNGQQFASANHQVPRDKQSLERGYRCCTLAIFMGHHTFHFHPVYLPPWSHPTLALQQSMAPY